MEYLKIFPNPKPKTTSTKFVWTFWFLVQVYIVIQTIMVVLQSTLLNPVASLSDSVINNLGQLGASLAAGYVGIVISNIIFRKIYSVWKT